VGKRRPIKIWDTDGKVRGEKRKAQKGLGHFFSTKGEEWEGEPLGNFGLKPKGRGGGEKRGRIEKGRT